MNIIQRIIIVVGCGAVAAVTVLTPKIQLIEGKLYPEGRADYLANTVDYSSVLVYVIAITLITVGLVWAAKSNAHAKKEKE